MNIKGIYTLKNRLLEVRRKKKISPSKICKKASLEKELYMNIEKGIEVPSMQTAIVIAKILNTPVYKIFFLSKGD